MVVDETVRDLEIVGPQKAEVILACSGRLFYVVKGASIGVFENPNY